MFSKHLSTITPIQNPPSMEYAVQHGDQSLLLSGSGSTLTIRNVEYETSEVLQRRIFPCQNIHGITSGPSQKCGSLIVTRVAIWGGKLLCFATISTQHDNCRITSSDVSFESHHDVGDWVLSAQIDVATQSVILLTAHNTLLRTSISSASDEHQKDFDTIAQGPQTLLYSGHIVQSELQLIIASGTVFGEIMVWTCSRNDTHGWTTRIRHTFLGHQGSVFGVCLSQSFNFSGCLRRLLASCSDDRTIRIWDVSDCDNTADNTTEISIINRDTGFGGKHGEDTHLAMAWGHLSRIWGVYFMPDLATSDITHLGLLSRGEDGVCQRWEINLDLLSSETEKSTSALKQIHYDRYHTGKNAWSLAHTMINDQHLIFTGGADGKIVLRRWELLTNNLEQPQVNIPFRQILTATTTKPVADGLAQTAKSFKQYLISESGEFVATTEIGQVLASTVDGLDDWATAGSSEVRAPIVLSSNQSADFAFFGNADGSISGYDMAKRRILQLPVLLPAPASWMQIVHASTQDSDGSLRFDLLVNIFGHKTRLVSIQKSPTGVDVKQYQIDIPTDFIVTSGFYEKQCKLLVCGSRAGALAILQLEAQPGDADSTNSVTVIRHLHGSDAITSIVELPASHQQSQDDMCVLTTGRDGTFASHIISNASTLKTIHRSSPPLGPYIEGAYIKEQASNNPSIILYGFQSKNFMVWDETKQTQLALIDCGGAHRSWNYSSSSSSRSFGTFVWTRAGTLNRYRIGTTSHEIIQKGGHGREIKAVAVGSLEAVSNQSRNTTLVATGAEDTDIRLYGAVSKVPGSDGYNCIAVLKEHTTGLQHLMFSQCGHFLFSSAGCEEFFVWKLHHASLLGIGTVLVAKLTKEVEDSDARIMSFDVVEEERDEEYRKFHIIMAYSNGKTKLVTYKHDSIKDTHVLQTNQQFDAGSICLTQAQILTCGQQRLFMTGATDGSLRLVAETTTTEPILLHCVHQSNIAALALDTIDASHYIVATGGDDNALGITYLDLDDNWAASRPSTKVMSDAHAAALTAIAITKKPHKHADDSVLIVTAGNDQKVKLWRARRRSKANSVDGRAEQESDDQTGGIEIELVDECWTDVADVSDIGILDCEVLPLRDPAGSSETRFEVLVVGVGMQTVVFKLQLDTM